MPPTTPFLDVPAVLDVLNEMDVLGVPESLGVLDVSSTLFLGVFNGFVSLKFSCCPFDTVA